MFKQITQDVSCHDDFCRYKFNIAIIIIAAAAGGYINKIVIKILKLLHMQILRVLPKTYLNAPI